MCKFVVDTNYVPMLFTNYTKKTHLMKRKFIALFTTVLLALFYYAHDTHAGTVNSKNFTPDYALAQYDIASGSYTIEVSDVSVDNPAATLKIVVQPPFWLSIWAIIIYALVFVGSMLYVVRIVQRSNKAPNNNAALPARSVQQPEPQPVDDAIEQQPSVADEPQLVEPEPEPLHITSLDEKLVDDAVKYVDANMARTDLSVEELSRELGMSRVHLYKRLRQITGKTPIEFIRLLRLKRAAQLLRESQLNVSEIAYKVGFNSPKYFSNYFKQEFGVLPSAYQSSSEHKDDAAETA
jgi:AraC-like DNA-binding protein